MTTPTPGPGPAPVTPALPAVPPPAPAPEPAAPPAATQPEAAPISNESFSWTRIDQLLGTAKAPATPPPEPQPEPPPPTDPNPPTQPAVAAEAKPEAPAAPEPAAKDKFGPEVLAQIRAQFRAEYPTDSDQVIDRLANNELDRRRQQSEKSRLLTRQMQQYKQPPALSSYDQHSPTAPTAGVDPAGSPFPAQTPPPPQLAAPPAPPAPEAQPMPDYMRSREAAAEALMVAIQSGDTRQVAEIQANIDAVNALIRQKEIEQRVEALVQERLKPILETTNEIAAQKQNIADTESALAHIEAHGYENARDTLYRTLSTEPLVIDGQQVEDNVLNRIVLNHPSIRYIHVPDADPRKASVKTKIARYEEAMNLYNRFYRDVETPAAPAPVAAPSTPAAAPVAPTSTGTQLPFSMDQIVQSVRQVMEREAADRARQGLNASSVSQPAVQSSNGTPLIAPDAGRIDRILGLRR